MVIYYTNTPIQVDMLTYQMDVNGIAYELHRTDSKDPFVIIDDKPMSYEEALLWVERRNEN